MRGFGYASRIGPAIVTGAADDDPSGIGTYSQVGAAFGFGLLWTSIVTLPLAAAVQECAARIGLVTGGGFAAAIGKRFSRPVVLGAVVLVAFANVFNIGADLASMSAAARLLVPVPAWIVLVAITAGLVTLEIAVSYPRYARVLRWLTASLLAYVGVLFVVDVDWSEVLRATFVPTLGLDRPELAALIAIFGTTISPYLFFWQASEEVEEEAASGMRPGPHPRIGRSHLQAMRGDVVAGMGAAVLVMFSIMVSAATALHEGGVTTIETADQAARALEPVAGSLASLLFTLGIVGTGALAIPVLAGSTAYALSEGFGWNEGLSRSFRQARGFYIVIAAATVVGLVMDLLGLDPIRSLYLAAILNGLAAPPLLLLLLILGNDRHTVGRWRSGRWSNLLVGAALLVMTATPIIYLVR
jgi:NRAMP (natural resistance-associated macrophage protein)-like metal ion transporter